MESPHWEHWRNMPRLPLWQAIALSCNVDPRIWGSRTPFDNFVKALRQSLPQLSQEFSERLEQAEAHAGLDRSSSLELLSYAPPCYLCDVSLMKFAAWTRNVVKWKTPNEILEIADRVPMEREQTATRWPWGNYETALLKHLAAAAERFWTRYDPGDQTTAPTSETIENWLVSNDVPKRVAEVMAQILRADGLKTGPRK